MSCSKPLLPFVCDALYYLNREQLERFSIAGRSLKNFIERYLHSKPYRVFSRLMIRGGSYALFHNGVHWHPDRDDYSAQQFLATQECIIEGTWNDPSYYSFVQMRPYLGPTIRVIETRIFVAGSSAYNSEHIAEMESIAYLWRDGKIGIRHVNDLVTRIDADDLHLILNSPTILQRPNLVMVNAHFSFKDYKILYAVNMLNIIQNIEDEIDLWQQHWEKFLEQSGAKPLVCFCFLSRQNVDKLLDRLSKAFSSAVSPNAFKILFIQDGEPLAKFRDMNYTSREKFELKNGLPAEYEEEKYDSYTLERSSI